MNQLIQWFNDEKHRELLYLSISLVSLGLSFWGWARQHLPFDLAWIAIFLCGLPIIKDAAVALFTRFDIRADVLVAIALIAAAGSGEIFAAGEVAVIMRLGALLEELTTNKTRQGMEKLIKLTPRTARLLEDGDEKIIPAEEVPVGAVLRVLPGETVAVDGVILSGETAIDQSVMTGESLPADKHPGDEVFSGTLNQFGSFDMRATRVGADSSLQRMIRLVAAADAGRAKIVCLTDRWATWIVVFALTAAAATWWLTGEVIRAVTILVVFCPCALVLATPTAIIAGIGNASRHGALIRSGDTLERLAAVKRIAFDKTGTLTHGRPEVVAVESLNDLFPESQLLLLAAAAELRSEHPLGRAVIRHARGLGISPPETADFRMLPGQGVSARVNGQTIWAGNGELLKEQDISMDDTLLNAAARYRSQGCTLIFIAIQRAAAGLIALADTLRPSSQETIARIHALGVKTALLTGDNQEAAAHIGKQVGIDQIYAGLLPEDKMTIIKTRQLVHHEPICMIGDGVNDAPALKIASVGVAMGGVGSDIAVEAAGIALVGDDLARLPHLLRLARRTLGTIKVNIIISLLLNFSAIILATLGLLGPVAGALVHNLGSVLVVLSSASLLKLKESASSF